ncbi:hypothetical protein C4D60_Mb05t23850 [Musa balbisiana]|uniref:Uncharacterized protein n=1 Tax=Musa balbisiana TaxID=52838 RepID=A0A4S8JYD7_MUSBA|nr:hypothetical protein C4D60_Mb05t23850 [Musa balbisiana]
MSCASGAAPRRLSVLLFLLPFGSEALGSASFSSASSSDYSSDGDLGSCSGNEEAFDAPKALREMNKVFNRKILSGESQDNSRRVHLKSRDNVQDSPKFEKVLSPRRLAGAET